MHTGMGKKIGNVVGQYVCMDEEKYGGFMRLRVEVDVIKPLKRMMQIQVAGRESCKVLIRFEKLPIYCFECGCIGHKD